jgi:hypothetical protein
MKIIKKLFIFSLLIIVLVSLVESKTRKNLKKNRNHNAQKSIPNFDLNNINPRAPGYVNTMPCPNGFGLNSNFSYLNCYGNGSDSIPFWRGSASNSYCCVKKEFGTITACSKLGLVNSKKHWRDCPLVGGQEPDRMGHFKFQPGYLILGQKCCKHPDTDIQHDPNCPKDSPIKNWNYGISMSWNQDGVYLTAETQNTTFTTITAYNTWFKSKYPSGSGGTQNPSWDYFHYTFCTLPTDTNGSSAADTSSF